jgi:hypothetical protein
MGNKKGLLAQALVQRIGSADYFWDSTQAASFFASASLT